MPHDSNVIVHPGQLRAQLVLAASATNAALAAVQQAVQQVGDAHALVAAMVTAGPPSSAASPAAWTRELSTRLRNALRAEFGASKLSELTREAVRSKGARHWRRAPNVGEMSVITLNAAVGGFADYEAFLAQSQHAARRRRAALRQAAEQLGVTGPAGALLEQLTNALRPPQTRMSGALLRTDPGRAAVTILWLRGHAQRRLARCFGLTGGTAINRAIVTLLRQYLPARAINGSAAQGRRKWLALQAVNYYLAAAAAAPSQQTGRDATWAKHG